jgi:hypothetical protein
MRPRDLFRRLSLDVKLISSYLVILGIGGLAISDVGSWIVSTTIWREAQRTVAHDLAIAHGTIAVESEVGAGTTFTIRLPVTARFRAEIPVLETEPA